MLSMVAAKKNNLIKLKTFGMIILTEKKLIPVFLFAILNSCNQLTSTSYEIPKCDTSLNLESHLFKKGNVVNKNGRVNPTFSFTQDDVKKIGLMQYDKGYDSIAIRLFYNYFGPEADIVEIRKNCEGWIGQYIKIKRRTENENVKVDVLKKVFVIPKSGWQKFTNKIFDLGITTLPDFSEIPNYNPSNDGHSLNVEISTKTYYRIYSYLNPKTKPDIEQAQKIEQIMDLIEQEFSINRKIKI